MYKKVEFMPRFLAALIDGLIAWVPVFIPVVGGILGALYLLVKDGLMYEITKKEEWKNKSIGKKILNLKVLIINEEGEEGEEEKKKEEKDDRVDLVISAKRNIPLAIGSFIAIIPLLGWIIGPIVSAVMVIIELTLYFSDEKGRRYGDRMAGTQVIKVKTEEEPIIVKED